MLDCVTTCEIPCEITCLADTLNDIFIAMPRIDVYGFPPVVCVDYFLSKWFYDFTQVICSVSIRDDSLMSCIRLSKTAKPVVSILLRGLCKMSIKRVFD